MEEKFLQYFSKFRILNEDEKDIIRKDLVITTFKKKTILLNEGQVSHDNFFVLQGCVRQYIIKDGVERITNFYTEEDWILPAIGQQEQSAFSLSCTEESTLVVANDSQGDDLAKTNPKFLELSQLILEKEIMAQHEHFAKYQNSTPEERYLILQQNRPGLIQRISQLQLASYIGVKPESLSRIKKRIANK